MCHFREYQNNNKIPEVIDLLGVQIVFNPRKAQKTALHENTTEIYVFVTCHVIACLTFKMWKLRGGDVAFVSMLQKRGISAPFLTCGFHISIPEHKLLF